MRPESHEPSSSDQLRRHVTVYLPALNLAGEQVFSRSLTVVNFGNMNELSPTRRGASDEPAPKPIG